MSSTGNGSIGSEGAAGAGRSWAGRKPVHAPRADGAALPGPSEPPPVDLQGLLVALVLVPRSYARNRFEPMYRRADVRRVRRRAAMVRSIVGDLLCGVGGEVVRLDRLQRLAEGGIWMSYQAPSIGLRRTSQLSCLELDLVRHLVGRAQRLRAGGAARFKSWRPAQGTERLLESGSGDGRPLASALERLFRSVPSSR